MCDDVHGALALRAWGSTNDGLGLGSVLGGLVLLHSPLLALSRSWNEASYLMWATVDQRYSVLGLGTLGWSSQLYPSPPLLGPQPCLRLHLCP